VTTAAETRPLAIEARDIVRNFGTSVALAGVSLTVHGGEVVAVMGPSGSGKSTLLHCLGAIDRPDGGAVEFQGGDITGISERDRAALRRRHFGFVFQFGRLVPELSIEENVILPLLLDGASATAARRRAHDLLGRLGIGHLARRALGEVSGGEAQRAAVARALVAGPSVVFADEPTGALDSKNGAVVLDLLLEAAAAEGAAVVLVTHDAGVAGRADRVVALQDGRVATADAA
jgi:putative ABC transport system ATP-binding protein